jgi:imidazolonepropionase-like amidohydrolase
MRKRLVLILAAVVAGVIGVCALALWCAPLSDMACGAGARMFCTGDEISSPSARTTPIPAAAKGVEVAIVGGRIFTNDSAGVIENGSVLVRDGRIVAIGKDIEIPKSANRIDAQGKWVTPGLIAPFSRLGIVEVELEDAANDARVTDSDIAAAADVARAFDPAAIPIAVTRVAGVTRAMVAPIGGPSPIAGYGAAVDLSGEAGAVNRARAFVYIEMGDTGADRAGHSRMTLWPYLEAAFADARDYRSRFRNTSQGSVLRRSEAEALRGVLTGEIPILMHVDSAADIRQALELKAERPRIRLALVGAAEGWRVASQIAAAKVPVIVDPLANLPASFSMLGARLDNPALLAKAGVKVAIGTAPDDADAHQIRLLTQSAGNAVANGMDWADALRAITSVPAEIFSLPDVGVLKAGALADLVVWDGDPLEVMSAPTAVFIAGAPVSLVSRQTGLRDRYLDLKNPTERPFQYR